jgi:NADH-quinone oxidoreductase subunit N
MQPAAQIFTLGYLWPMLPEIVVVLGAMSLLMLGVFRDEKASGRLISWAALAVLALAAAELVMLGNTRETLFGGAFIADPFARFAKLAVLAGAVGALILSLEEAKEATLDRFEYPVLVLLSTAGMMLMVSAGDLISLYVGLELQSLALYVLAAFRRDQVRSSEAGLKYFVLGALSSGMLLYGASLIYGFTGATTFSGIAAAIKSQGGGLDIGLVFGLVFLLAGLAFKVSAVPFHMWTPDVYEGAPTPVTAFFAAAPKVAAMALLTRVVLSAFPGIQPQWQQIVYFLAIASMGLGAFAAIGQTNIKRLMAYSSIANVGFMLVGLAAGTAEGAQGVLIYLAIYVAMTLGAFACIIAMRRDGEPVEEIDQLAGLARNDLPMATLFAILLFSLAGIPPLAGFFGKFYVFLAAINAGHYVLAVIGVIASVVGAYYYVRIVKVMFFDEPAARFERMPLGLKAVLGLAGFLMVAFVLYPAPLVAAAESAARSMF